MNNKDQEQLILKELGNSRNRKELLKLGDLGTFLHPQNWDMMLWKEKKEHSRKKQEFLEI